MRWDILISYPHPREKRVFFATLVVENERNMNKSTRIRKKMTSIIKENFEDLLEHSPSFLTASDLVKIGLFPSTLAVYQAKQRGETPPCILISERKLRFSKNGLISWLSARQLPVSHSV